MPAPDYIPIYREMVRSRQVLRIVRETGRTRQHVVGVLVDLWLWVTSETADGRIDGIGRADLCEAIGEDEPFWCAVESAGWIAIDDGGVTVPKFDAKLSTAAVSRLNSRERKRKQRQEVTKGVTDMSQECHKKTGQKRDQKRREENTREEKKEEKETEKPLEYPPHLDNDRCRAAWADWVDWRKRSGKRFVDPQQQQRALNKAGREYPTAALFCEAVDHSVAGGFQGLYGPGDRRRGSPSGSSPRTAATKQAMAEFVAEGGDA